MNETKHTPGPWKVVGPYVAIDKAVICKYCDNEQGPVQWAASPADLVATANARLIAAAPELLEALEDLIFHYEALQQLDGHKATAIARSTAKARTAIAKAKGE